MKKLLVLLAMVLAFTYTSVAQTGTSSSTGKSDQTTTSKSKSKTSDTSSDGMKSDSMGKTKAKKEATLTGCLNGDMLSNGRYKKGVKVGPEDKIKEHSGHQVTLKGEWSGTGADKMFNVASVKHISDTCKEAPGGGTTGMTKKGKKDTEKGKDAGATPPKQ